MSNRTASPDTPDPSVLSLLMVATVASTIAAFLTPYARHFRSLGWRVEAAANAAPGDLRLQDAFDQLHDVPVSRSLRDLTGLEQGRRALELILAGTRPDIVHVHTPIASMLARLAVARMPADQRPLVAYTAHGF